MSLPNAQTHGPPIFGIVHSQIPIDPNLEVILSGIGKPSVAVSRVEADLRVFTDRQVPNSLNEDFISFSGIAAQPELAHAQHAGLATISRRGYLHDMRAQKRERKARKKDVKRERKKERKRESKRQRRALRAAQKEAHNSRVRATAPSPEPVGVRNQRFQQNTTILQRRELQSMQRAERAAHRCAAKDPGHEATNLHVPGTRAKLHNVLASCQEPTHKYNLRQRDNGGNAKTDLSEWKDRDSYGNPEDVMRQKKDKSPEPENIFPQEAVLFVHQSIEPSGPTIHCQLRNSVFPGRINIQQRAEAISFAASIWDDQASAKGKRQLVLWVDGSWSQLHQIGGASVVLSKVPQTQVLTYEAFTLRGLDSSTDAEIFAIEAGLESAVFETTTRSPLPNVSAGSGTVLLFSDCTGALKCAAGDSIPLWTYSFRRTLVEKIDMHIRKLQSRGYDIQFHWVPGHAGVQGNVLADTLAGRATSYGIGHKSLGPSTKEVEVRQLPPGRLGFNPLTGLPYVRPCTEK